MMKSRSLGKWHLELKSTTCEYGLYPSSSSNEVQTTSQIEMGNFKTTLSADSVGSGRSTLNATERNSPKAYHTA
ncbi:hypothetical protein YC2023_059976 [Brassica napus]